MRIGVTVASIDKPVHHNHQQLADEHLERLDRRLLEQFGVVGVTVADTLVVLVLGKERVGGTTHEGPRDNEPDVVSCHWRRKSRVY